MDDLLAGNTGPYDLQVADSPGFGVVLTKDPDVFLVTYTGSRVGFNAIKFN